jgi:hypothetical protein
LSNPLYLSSLFWFSKNTPCKVRVSCINLVTCDTNLGSRGSAMAASPFHLSLWMPNSRGGCRIHLATPTRRTVQMAPGWLSPNA